MLKNPSKALLDKGNDPPHKATRQLEDETSHLAPHQQHAPTQQINATSAQVQATNEGASILVAATIPVISAPVLPLGLSSVPTASVISPFATLVPSAGPRVTFPPSMAQFMNDPANLQAIQGFGQTPMPQPSPFQPQLVSTMARVNLTDALNVAGPSRPPQATDPQVTPDGHCVSIESDDGDWDIPRAHKKKKGKIIRPATSRNSAFERLGDREEGQRKSAKQRLGQSVAHVSAFARLGEVREAEPACTRRSRSNRQEPARTRASHQEGEAESQPRLLVANRLTIPNDRVQQMEAKLERLEKKVGEKNDRDKPLAGSPFTARVHLTPFPRKTLRNRATEWFNKLRPGSIDSFSDLASKFKAKFQENCTKRKKFTYLSTAGQRESENFTQFLTRWKEEVDKVEEMDDKTVLSLLLNGLRAGELYKEFCRKPPATCQEAYHTAWEFAEAETQLRAKREAEHDLPVNKPTEQWWEMAVDGASGPRGYGGGIVFTTPGGFKIYHAIVFNFKLTNNEAEYEALAGGLRLAQALKISRVSIKSYSSLIVGQVTGNMEAREGRMAQYKDLVLALLKGFEEFKIAQIPRAENADADLLSKLTQRASWVDRIHLAKPIETQARTWHAGYYTGLAQYNRKNIKTRKRGPEEGMPARGLDLEEGSNRTYTGP
ncbi:unnamed protein product [Cuscuta campestris]|uniref:RNase H type-1 domain-containing protein n=1 Tax=Cuscuta campestris TaxID=132261 RepID=A0A484KFA8_9ASTE|nr:unnamed protein product [Cuscuta campestris]